MCPTQRLGMRCNQAASGAFLPRPRDHSDVIDPKADVLLDTPIAR